MGTGIDSGSRNGIISRMVLRLREIDGSLAANHRFYAVLAAAVGGFRKNRLRYHTYYFTVSAFMGVLALVVVVSSLVSLLPRGRFRVDLLNSMTTALPIMRGGSGEALNVFRESVVLGIISIVFLVWTATRIFEALESGFNIVWGTERRRFGPRMLIGTLMILLIGVLFLVAFCIQFGFNGLWAGVVEKASVGYYLGLSTAKPAIGFAADFLLFLFIYRFVTGVKPGWKSCAKAAALVAFLFLGSQYLLNLYFDYIYKVPEIFGSLASGIIVILWLQLTGMATFYGAEVVKALEDERVVSAYMETRAAGNEGDGSAGRGRSG